jgi:hypothetical protein
MYDDDDELDEASKDEQKAAIEAAKAKMDQGKAMMNAAKEDMKAAKDMKIEEAIDKLSYRDKQLIKRFQKTASDNPGLTDIELFARRNKLTASQIYLLKKVFTSDDFKITSTGPLPSDIAPRLRKI